MRALSNQLRRFLLDEQASMTVEFVIWIPWLLFYLTFSTTAFLAMDSRLEAMRASITLTDIISREEDPITEEFITDLKVMMNELTPSAAAGGMIRVSVLKLEAEGLTVKWTKCIGGIEALTEDNLPSDILPYLAPLSEIILVETFIPYIPVSGVFGIKPAVWANRKAVTPRYVQQVILDSAVTDDCGSKSVS